MLVQVYVGHGSTCWYCGQARAEPACAAEITMYGDVVSGVMDGLIVPVAGRPDNSIDKAIVPVARCARCQALHEDKTLVRWGVLIGGLVGGALTLAVVQGPGLILCLAFIGFCLGVGWARLLGKSCLETLLYGAVGAIVVYVPAAAWHLPPIVYQAFAVIAGLGGGALLGYLVDSLRHEARVKRAGVKLQEDVVDYPPVAALLGHGWVITIPPPEGN